MFKQNKGRRQGVIILSRGNRCAKVRAGSLVQDGGLLWAVKSGWNVMQGAGSGEVSCVSWKALWRQELTYQLRPSDIRLNHEGTVLEGWMP